MGLFGKKKIEEELEQLRARNAYLEYYLSPEIRETDAASKQLAQLKSEVAAWQKSYNDFSAAVNSLKIEQSQLVQSIDSKRKESLYLDDILLAEEYGLYEPTFNFANSTQYKGALKAVRDEQKAALRSLNENVKNTSWTVNNSRTQGKKMVRDTYKLLMRAFNTECDDLIEKVRSSNIDRTIERIWKSSETITKLGSVLGISIPHYYVQLKDREARLAFEYALAKEAEKEAIREAKALEREELKVQKEIEAKRKDLQNEKNKYEKALLEAKKKLAAAFGDDLEALKQKIIELESNISEVDRGIADVDYREANKRAGFVYIISNIGSFGNDVFKIGMTRRLNPTERISELSDASVPFNFDVHALIFSDDAPRLEAALHRSFEGKKVNLVNSRREFFRCSLDDIKNAVISNYDKTVDFIDIPEADQFRISEAMRSNAKEGTGTQSI